MSLIILTFLAVLVLIGGIYLAVKKESKFMKFGAVVLTVVVLAQLVLTSYFILL